MTTSPPPSTFTCSHHQNAVLEFTIGETQMAWLDGWDNQLSQPALWAESP